MFLFKQDGYFSCIFLETSQEFSFEAKPENYKISQFLNSLQTKIFTHFPLIFILTKNNSNSAKLSHIYSARSMKLLEEVAGTKIMAAERLVTSK